MSLAKGKVPSDWKKANTIPIYKEGRQEELLNYNPVSLTNVVAKICKSAIKDRWPNTRQKLT